MDSEKTLLGEERRVFSDRLSHHGHWTLEVEVEGSISVDFVFVSRMNPTSGVR